MSKPEKTLTFDTEKVYPVNLEFFENSVKITGYRCDDEVNDHIHCVMNDLIELNPDFQHCSTMRGLNYDASPQVVMFFREKTFLEKLFFKGSPDEILTLDVERVYPVELEFYKNFVKITGYSGDIMVSKHIHSVMESLIKLNPDLQHYSTMRYPNRYGALEVVMFLRKKYFWEKQFSKKK